MDLRYAYGDIEQDVYYKFLSQIEKQIVDLEANYNFVGIDVSNLKSSLNKAIDFTQNVSKYRVSGNLDHKPRIQKLLFPEGLVIDTEKHQYLTSKTNALFALKRSYSNSIKA